MIEIKPSLQKSFHCRSCNSPIENQGIVWQGMHVCIKGNCDACNTTVIEPLRIGHSRYNPCQVQLEKDLILCDTPAKGWLGKRLLSSLSTPQLEIVDLKKEVLKSSDKVIIVNCIDYRYGHCLLKLLNVQRHLERDQDYGVVIIVQKFLRWLVPSDVSEIWTVDIPLSKGDDYYLDLNGHILNELNRFKEVRLSESFSHPAKFNISRFTGIEKHDFEQTDFRITFVWREDRLWLGNFSSKLVQKVNLFSHPIFCQNWKVRRMLYGLRQYMPKAKFTVAGLGRTTEFPEWIEDLRVDRFDEHSERNLCKVFSESRVVVGVHGSNMLLPSGHAGITVNLMPNSRWDNFAQDILYQESDPRMAAYRYRYIPIETSIIEIQKIVTSSVQKYSYFKKQMLSDAEKL